MMEIRAVEHCPWCGHAQNIIWVHGHGQCAHCGVNYAPCCQGDADNGGHCMIGAPDSATSMVG